MRCEAVNSSHQSKFSRGRFALLSLVACLLGGIIGFAMLALLVWASNQSWVIDEPDSHGISEFQSSRLGGIIVFFGSIAFFLAAEWTTGDAGISLNTLVSSAQHLPGYTVFALLIGLVGLWDDSVAYLSPIARLLAVSIISSAALLSNVVPIPPSIYGWLPFGLNGVWFLTVGAALVVTGFVNAGNMADGANGLLAIVTISFLSISQVGDGNFASMLILGLLIFLVFNVATGRMFLGDFGAYGLSAMIAFGSLEFYASGTVSLWFLVSLLAYPCIEIVRVIVYRAVRGHSPTRAANDHLHNYLYDWIRGWGWNRTLANSTTGCFLGIISAALPALLVLLGGVDKGNSFFWAPYCLAYSALHLILASSLKRVLKTT